MADTAEEVFSIAVVVIVFGFLVVVVPLWACFWGKVLTSCEWFELMSGLSPVPEPPMQSSSSSQFSLPGPLSVEEEKNKFGQKS